MPDPIGVDYAEKFESMEGGADGNGQWEKRAYHVAWEDKEAFMDQMAGVIRQDGGTGGPFIVTAAYQCPGNPRLYAQNISWKPIGQPIIPSNPGRFSHAEVAVVFRVPEFGAIAYDPALTLDPNEPLLKHCQVELDFGQQTFAIRGGSKWLSDGKHRVDPLGISVKTIEMEFLWNDFPFMPWDILREYDGAINDDVFLGCPRGTVKLHGPKCHIERNRNGKQGLRLRVFMQYRSESWNKVLREDTGEWDTPVDNAYTGGPSGDSSGFELCEYKDFRTLLWKDYFEDEEGGGGEGGDEPLAA